MPTARTRVSVVVLRLGLAPSQTWHTLSISAMFEHSGVIVEDGRIPWVQTVEAVLDLAPSINADFDQEPLTCNVPALLDGCLGAESDEGLLLESLETLDGLLKTTSVIFASPPRLGSSATLRSFHQQLESGETSHSALARVGGSALAVPAVMDAVDRVLSASDFRTPD